MRLIEWISLGQGVAWSGGGVAELLPFFGKSEAYTLGKGGSTPPPLEGGHRANKITGSRWCRFRNFFRPKVPHIFWLWNCSFVLLVSFPPTWRYSRANKKPREVLEISTLFWGPKPKKKVFLTTFWPLTRPKGQFEARNGVKSCSLSYSEHID